MASISEYEEILGQRFAYIVKAHLELSQEETFEADADLVEIGESYVTALLQHGDEKPASVIFVSAVTGGIVASSHWRMIRENKQAMILYLCESEVTDEALGLMQATDLESEQAKRYLVMVSDLITEAVSLVGEYCDNADAVEYIYTTLLQLYQMGIMIEQRRER